MKSKDMILSDFLLQQDNDDSNRNQIIPISFHIDMFNILENNLDDFDKNNSLNNSKYLVQMYSQAKPVVQSSWSREKPKPELKTRKTTCHYQTRKA